MLTLQTLQSGGLVVYAIGAASVIGLACVVYCFMVLRRPVVLAKSLVQMATTLNNAGNCEEAEDLCRKEGGPFAEILLTVIASRRIGREEAEALVESAGRRAEHTLNRGTLVLEVLAAITPLMGLLGTVMGMFTVFDKISKIGVKEAGQLSGGISEALVTTICGLIVAIPAYVAFTWFSRKVDDLVLEMERHAVNLMLRLRS